MSDGVLRNFQRAAVRTAQQWLSLVDRGEFATSWSNASTALRQALACEQWVRALTSARGPLGGVIMRRLQSVQEGPEGELILDFETEFEFYESAHERLLPVQDEQGNWVVSGYEIN